MEIKDILYSIIKDIGLEHIKKSVNQDIHNSKQIIIEIFTRFTLFLRKNSYYTNNTSINSQIAFVDSDGNTIDNQDLFVIFAESLLHFLLTVAVIPSERKKDYNGLKLDIVIPNLRILKSTPNNAILLLFHKNLDNIDNHNNNNTNFMKKIEQIPSVLSISDQNIWIISSSSFSNSRFKQYIIDLNSSQKHKEISIEKSNNNNNNNSILNNIHDYSDIIVDLSAFLKKSGDKTLRIVHM